MPPSTCQVSGAVLTLTHPVRSLPLNRSLNAGMSLDCAPAATRSRHPARPAIANDFMAHSAPQAIDSISARGDAFDGVGECQEVRAGFQLLAEEEGFEPPCESPRKRFSRPPVSTTHPFLRPPLLYAVEFYAPP